MRKSTNLEKEQYAVLFRERKRKPEEWRMIGIYFDDKPTKERIEKMGFGFIYEDGYEMKILEK